MGSYTSLQNIPFAAYYERGLTGELIMSPTFKGVFFSMITSTRSPGSIPRISRVEAGIVIRPSGSTLAENADVVMMES